jgi:hypothetical protein
MVTTAWVGRKLFLRIGIRYGYDNLFIPGGQIVMGQAAFYFNQ